MSAAMTFVLNVSAAANPKIPEPQPISKMFFGRLNRDISSMAVKQPLVVKCSPEPKAVAASIFKDSFVFGGGS